MSEDKSGPAFPVPDCNDCGTRHQGGMHGIGLTKREYFAANAMQGELAAQTEESGFYREGNEEPLVRVAVKRADALLAALAEKQEPKEDDLLKAAKETMDMLNLMCNYRNNIPDYDNLICTRLGAAIKAREAKP